MIQKNHKMHGKVPFGLNLQAGKIWRVKVCLMEKGEMHGPFVPRNFVHFFPFYNHALFHPFVLHTAATTAVLIKQICHSAEASVCCHAGSQEPVRVAVGLRQSQRSLKGQRMQSGRQQTDSGDLALICVHIKYPIKYSWD